MAVSVFSGWESGLELAEIPFVQKNAWVCFRISSSFIGNNPSLQIRSFCEDWGKCNKTGNPSIANFSTIPTSHILNLADTSYLLNDDSYTLSLSLLCYCLSTPCYECKSNARHFVAKLFIKACCCWEKMCLSYQVPSVDSLELTLYHTSSNICDFHSPVDVGLNVPFPHIFWFLHQNRLGIPGFTLPKLRNVGDEDKTIWSSLDTSSLMIAQPVLQQSALCALKKTDWPKSDCYKFFALGTF